MKVNMQLLDVRSFLEQKKLFLKAMSVIEKVVRTKFILLIAANTTDNTIGKGCIVDTHSIRKIFRKLSKEMDFNYTELIIKGEDYSKENIIEAITMLTPGNNDIVVFYYSGHGFSYEKDTAKKYPQIDMRPYNSSDKIDVVNAHTENLADLFQLIKGRGARLNIIIGDCCNSQIEFKRKFKGGLGIDRKKVPTVINKQSCEVLFCDYTASILVASAGKGEYAVSDDQLGSLFTYNFSNNLKMLMKKDIDKSEGLPWEKLLEDTRNNTLELSKTYDIGNGVAGNQQAIYNIEFRKTLY